MLTCIDITRGYFHIPACGILQGLFAFRVGEKRYEYKCSPQSWPASAIAFHLRVVQALGDRQTIEYADNLLVGGDKREEHDLKLRKVFHKLEDM